MPSLGTESPAPALNSPRRSSGWRTAPRQSAAWRQAAALTNFSLFPPPRLGWAGRFTAEAESWGKLDAGTEPIFSSSRAPDSLQADPGQPPARRSAQPLVLQCMFLTLRGPRSLRGRIQAWQRRVAWIVEQGAVAEVQVYTVARRPSDSLARSPQRFREDR